MPGRTSAAKRQTNDTKRLEKSIADEILRYLNSLPCCHAEKIHRGTYDLRGTPDILGALNGRALALEVKRPGNDATPLQQYVMGKWAQAGAITGVVRSVDDVRALLNKEET